ncbi:MAG: ATP-binding cassette domain-containing protein [Woeseiaceae bacterium]
MIHIQNIAKSFGKVTAVSDVSFDAPNGRITGLLGPNGAGKSTTLRVLYTAIKPDTGSASIDGIDVVANPLEARKALGALPHGGGLYQQLTARENIAYFAEMHGLRGQAAKQAVQEMIELLEIEEFADRRTKGFSQGQKTKVALARALVHGPQNVILDEPTNGLDVMATRSLRKIIRKLKAQGKCILFSSHVMQEVAALCDEIVIIADGKVSITGTTDHIQEATGCDDLEDAFVAAISVNADALGSRTRMQTGGRDFSSSLPGAGE